MLQLRSKETLDRGDYGWLTARHHFVVSAKGNLANGALGDADAMAGKKDGADLRCRAGGQLDP